MPQISDQAYLQKEQYQNATNLDARIRLHKHYSTNPYGLPRWMFDRFTIPAGASLLEVGAGSGNIWRENADRTPTSWHTLLSDFSPGMIHQTRETLATTLPRAYFLGADAQHLPLPDASFDVVIANFMLYHVPDRDQAIAEFRRVLKPGGQLYAATNGQDHLRELRELTARFDPLIEFWQDQGGGSFSLENGGDQLRAHFADIALHPYEDAIVVNDAAAVVDYVASFAPIGETQRTMFRDFVADEIAHSGGAIRITKAPGLFVAS